MRTIFHCLHTHERHCTVNRFGIPTLLCFIRKNMPKIQFYQCNSQFIHTRRGRTQVNGSGRRRRGRRTEMNIDFPYYVLSNSSSKEAITITTTRNRRRTTANSVMCNGGTYIPSIEVVFDLLLLRMAVDEKLFQRNRFLHANAAPASVICRLFCPFFLVIPQMEGT